LFGTSLSFVVPFAILLSMDTVPSCCVLLFMDVLAILLLAESLAIVWELIPDVDDGCFVVVIVCPLTS